MKECLIDVLNARDTVLHVFSVAVEAQDGTPLAVNAEQEALRLAAAVQLVPEKDAEGLHARPHVERGGPLTPYGDVLDDRRRSLEKAEQRIRKRAYFLWQQQGSPDNQADEHWHQACELENNSGKR